MNMLEMEIEGGRPIDRLLSWKEDGRQKTKESKKKNCLKKRLIDVPLFVLHTPGGQLAEIMRQKI